MVACRAMTHEHPLRLLCPGSELPYDFEGLELRLKWPLLPMLVRQRVRPQAVSLCY